MLAEPKRLIVAITGATGIIYGVRLLHFLRNTTIEAHLIISKAGALNLQQELNIRRQDIESLADVVYSVHNIGASIASGSFLCMGMIIIPCSMKTLSSVANGLSENLISRAADVVLKERHRLILMIRETPLSLVHLRNMISVTEMGGIIFPPLPSFYHHPKSIDEMIDHTIGRMLDLFSIQHTLIPRWNGLKY